MFICKKVLHTPIRSALTYIYVNS